METRVCRTCGSRKSIRGIWYLIPPADRPSVLEGPSGPSGPGGFDMGAPEFLCESCFDQRGERDAPSGLGAHTDVASYWRHQPDRSA